MVRPPPSHATIATKQGRNAGGCLGHIAYRSATPAFDPVAARHGRGPAVLGHRHRPDPHLCVLRRSRGVGPRTGLRDDSGGPVTAGAVGDPGLVAGAPTRRGPWPEADA